MKNPPLDLKLLYYCYLQLQEVIGEQNKENVVIVGFTTLKADFTDSDKIDLSAICDVRNYVIVRDLAALISVFKGDVGNFWARKRRQEDHAR